MNVATISIPLDAEVAALYESASPEAQQKMQLLFEMLLREMASSNTEPLSKIMDRISDYAQAQGLTEEILEDLLSEDD